ncbi:MFS transporter [Nocardia brasiliensis]|uniref:MFS transporter n=1 Tax=Nocardia brasiliensis TaxID=37326 RepID=UPI002457F772|nr:MFS transporter [Nocardia brasiliensis]
MDHVDRRSGVDAESGGLQGVLAVVCVAQFMVVLDVSVVNVALPSIRDGLGFGATTLQWVVNAYVLTFAGLLLLGGRLADLFGRRRVFLSGLSVFTAASRAGGIATAAVPLVAARAVQGVGAAVLAPATLTILTTSIGEGPRRTRALAVWTAVGLAGGTAGNLLGGVLTQFLSWRSTLLINVPVGLLAAVAALRLLPADEDRRGMPQVDVAGAVLATAGLGVLAFGVTQAAANGWTASATVWGIGGGLALLAGFVVVEARWAAVPLVPLRLLGVRSIGVGNVMMLLAGACLNPMWYFLTLAMQNILGYPPLQTGLAFLPHTVVAILVATLVTPWLMRRIDSRVVIAAGCVLAAAGFWWQSNLGPAEDYVTAILGPAVVFSVGSGLHNTPVTTAVTSGVGPAEAGVASGLMNVAKQIGGGLGLAVLVSLAVPAGAATAYERAFMAMAAAMLVTGALAWLLPSRRDA